ncbi:MAG: hypothetical protein MUE69_22135 [Myxococcota bacterium]|jgi:hypothetical protein|nr:hypothetical protein [Myxococcota bacterium]
MRPKSYAARVLLSVGFASALFGGSVRAQESGAALDGPRNVTEARTRAADVSSRDRAENAIDSSGSTSERTTRRVGVELMLGTTAPLDVGVNARLVLFERVYVYGGLGVGVYGGVYDAVASGLVNGDAGSIARSLGNGAFVGRIGVGVRPFGEGLELSIGYLGIRRGVSVDASTVAAAAGMSAQPRDVDASMRIAAIHVELGWSLRLGERVLLRPTVGWAHGLGARVGLSSEGASATERAAIASIEESLTRGLRDRARTPTLGLQVGMRF